jgi:hypothetical protein
VNAARGLLAMICCAWVGANVALLAAAFTLFSPAGLAITADKAHSGKLFGLILADWSAVGGTLLALACVLLALMLAFHASRTARPVAATAWVLAGLAAIGCQLWYADLIGTMNLLQERIAHDKEAAATFRALHRQSLAAVAGESCAALLLALGALVGRSHQGDPAQGAKSARSADAH